MILNIAVSILDSNLRDCSEERTELKFKIFNIAGFNLIFNLISNFSLTDTISRAYRVI